MFLRRKWNKMVKIGRGMIGEIPYLEDGELVFAGKRGRCGSAAVVPSHARLLVV
jgi:hypothetical protein